MACECNYVMLSVCIILFIAVSAQTLSFALPGWLKWSPRYDIQSNYDPTKILFSANKTYESGLWVECEKDFKNCGEWIERTKQKIIAAAKCTITTVSGQQQTDTNCRPYTNSEIANWVTQTIGLFFLTMGLVFAIIASMALCCGDCCVGFFKFFVLLICMLAAMSITIGVVVYGVGYAESRANQIIIKDNVRIPVKSIQLYYSFGLSVAAASLALVAALITAFSTNDDGKP